MGFKEGCVCGGGGGGEGESKFYSYVFEMITQEVKIVVSLIKNGGKSTGFIKSR